MLRRNRTESSVTFHSDVRKREIMKLQVFPTPLVDIN
jgi:hypothetical protein